MPAKKYIVTLEKEEKECEFVAAMSDFSPRIYLMFMSENTMKNVYWYAWMNFRVNS